MANIEAIIVDGVRYDKVKKTEYPSEISCQECSLLEVCQKHELNWDCCEITGQDEIWKRKDEL